LIVTRRRDPQGTSISNRRIEDWDQIDAVGLWAMDGEVLNLPGVVTLWHARARVMRVCTASIEENCSAAKPSGLALDARQATSVVDNEVVPRVLTERQQNCEARSLEAEHHGKR
jgi:hypothetical protein